MPVWSLNSPVFEWPKREEVLAAARDWASKLRTDDPSVTRVYCIGSYARGDWGFGSDLDMIVILGDTQMSAKERYDRYCPAGLPVEADVWVYTEAEWMALETNSPSYWRRIQGELLNLLND